MEEKERPKLTLRDGLEVDALQAFARWEDLQDLQCLYPQHFDALLALVQERVACSDIAPESLDFLTRGGHLRNGEIDPLFGAVLRNGYRVTPDGPTLVSPFRLENQADRAVFEEVQRHNDATITKLIRRARRQQDDEGRSL